MFEEDDDFSASEEESELAKRLDKYKRRADSDSEVEVFGVGPDNEADSDENQSDLAISDVDEGDDDLPDPRAWGKERRKYYGTDYVDPDFGGFQGKDAEAAEIEQEEAKELQNQLMEQLDVDFSDIGDLIPKSQRDNNKSEELMVTDFSKLTNKQKMQNLKKESPEFFVLIDDFSAKLTLANDLLRPVIEQAKNGSIEPCKAVEFVQMHYRLILNYATNIYMYMLLKCSNKLKNHPISKRLYQYRQLLTQIEPVFEEIIKPQIPLLLEEAAKKQSSLAASAKKKKTLQLLAKLQNESAREAAQPNKKIKLDVENVVKKVRFEQEEEILNGKQEEGEEAEEIGKRAITYQIAKNKGLTPHRKKENRNPRVKHKLKFRKALIRRKGAVREPRKELNRYSGEMSGIKTSVSKSIKLKS